MLKIDHSYRSVSEAIKNPATENSCLSEQAVLTRMIEVLPQSPWANIEILDWLPDDNKLPIEYCFYNSSFGEVLVASTSKGICYLGLVEGKSEDILEDLKKRFRYTRPVEKENLLQKRVFDFLEGKQNESLQFHLKGTPYQIEIWRKLIRIPFGKVISYATLGGDPQCSRSAGTANGRNPIFFIIPCHRVVKTTGRFDRYFWGEEVKKRLLAWEFVNSSI